MSIEAMSAVLHHCQASPAAKLVLLGIANHQGDDGAYPSIDTLAKYANVSHRSVTRYIADLKLAKYVEVHEQAGRNGVNLYYVTIECPEDCDRSTNHRTRTAVSYPRTNYALPQDSSVLPPRTTVSYKPSYNLKLTNKEIEEKIRHDREARSRHANVIVLESERAKAQAVDSPQCEHGKSLVLCDICCAALASNQRN